ncbi:MAG: nucleotidyltransferase family protein [Lentimicrobiaceae bacterium]|nr:nucleotidyltransferase family protein [Lentimicrobiaceae bacterium]
MKAMIFAAGLGTRLKELTQHTPKALVKVGGITLLERTILKLKQAGVSGIIINTHHFAEQIADFVSQRNFGLNICISWEKDMLLDTGGGLKRAMPFFDKEPFIVHNVDIISDIDLQKMFSFHCRQKALATLAVRNRETQRYLLFDDNLQLCGRENTKTNEKTLIPTIPQNIHLQRFAFSGIQVVSPEIASFMPKKDVFPITELYLAAAQSQHIIGFPHNNDLWADMGKIEDINSSIFF